LNRTKTLLHTGILSIIIILLITSCSTKKNTFSRRVFHNLTSHYNAYWNGNESMKQGVAELSETAEENYTKIIPIFNYGTKDVGQSLAPYMDRAIEKGKKVCNIHSMEFNDVEYVRWIDDSYLMIGKGQFYKHEYMKARRTFEKVINKYHAPEKLEAMLWLGRSYNQMEEYGRAITTFDQLQNKLNAGEEGNKFITQMLPLMYAENMMLQKNYERAIPYILEGIAVSKDKQLKTRLIFILAQIYQEQERNNLATKYFTQVIKRNPNYEMTFNSHIRLATSLDANAENSQDVIDELLDMLDDIKNEDYKDQIYFALAEIEKNKNNDTSAIRYYRKSVATSFGNDYQKSTSALKVADIYFDRKQYKYSKLYYDSAMQVLPYDFPKYQDLQDRTLTLSRLVENITIVEEQDSLLTLAHMSEKERLNVIDNIIKEYQEEQRRIREQEQQERQSAAFSQQTMNRSARAGIGSAGGGWYFYNPQAISMGFSDFQQKWGRRKLEDNWRLSDKRRTSFSFSDDITMENDSINSDSTLTVSTDPASRESYLQYIPLTEKKQKASNEMIAKALINMGFIYDIQLNNIDESIASFKSFISRYPDNEETPKCYFQLYRTYDKIGDVTNADIYKQILLQKYPKSDYALIIQDPEYYKNLAQEKNKLKNLYKESFNAYKSDDFFTVKIICDDALNNYKEDKKITPKIKYLRALALGQLENQDTMKIELQNLVKDYPSSDVYGLAQNILRVMANNADTLSADEEAQEVIEQQLAHAMSLFSASPQEQHLYIMIVSEQNVNINATKVKLADFDTEFYKLKNLRVNSVILNQAKHMISVSRFDNKEEAMTYFNTIKNNSYVFSDIPEEAYQHFVISTSNYPVLYKSKDIAAYEIFFIKNYLDNTSNK